MGYFQLNGGAFGSLLDPAVSYSGQDVYGRQRTQLVEGEQADWALSWVGMTDIEFIELNGRIESAAGARVPITLPFGSATSWTSYYAHVRLAGFTRVDAQYVRNVRVEVIGASTTL